MEMMFSFNNFSLAAQNIINFALSEEQSFYIFHCNTKVLNNEATNESLKYIFLS